MKYYVIVTFLNGYGRCHKFAESNKLAGYASQDEAVKAGQVMREEANRYGVKYAAGFIVLLSKSGELKEVHNEFDAR